jgi:putative multiple sugar transport system permease protein
MLLLRGLTLVMLQGHPIGPSRRSGQNLQLFTIALGALMCVALVALEIRDRREQQKYGFGVSAPGIFLATSLMGVIAIMFLTWRLAAYSGYPILLIVMLLLTAVYRFVTLRTTLGRRIFAVGGNARAVLLSGVCTSRYVFFTFVSMGALSGSRRRTWRRSP